MSHWLKRRPIALFCAATLCGGASYLSAQNDYPAPAKTPEEAGEMFFELLSKGIYIRMDVPHESPKHLFRLLGAASRSQMATLDESKWGNGAEALFRVLISQAYETTSTGKIINDKKEKVAVEVHPRFKPKEVICIQEDGGWRVDLFATFGKWNNLSGAALDEAIYKITGRTTPAMRSSARFKRTECQSQLKQVMLAAKMYLQDNDEKMPPARRWSEVLHPYTKDRTLFNCPALLAGKTNGYAFNQNISQINESEFYEPAATVSIYETSNLNRNVFGPGTGRAFRHSDGANFAFIDGHVKWFSRSKSAKLSFKP
ncbi:MAG TPA: H-X9-DG-CTERM domain-containing protein [Abditibacterium sp.]